MNTIDAIKQRRSIRKFKSDKVSHETLEKVIEAAAYAPSWKNTQITRYIAVESEAVKEKVLEYLPSFNQTSVQSAPLLIAVTMIKNRSGYERDGSFSTKKGDRYQVYDAGIATEAFCLAAFEEGLGSVILGIFDEDEITKLLNIPKERELMALIAVGYPDEVPQPPKRKSVEELLSYL